MIKKYVRCAYVSPGTKRSRRATPAGNQITAEWQIWSDDQNVLCLFECRSVKYLKYICELELTVTVTVTVTVTMTVTTRSRPC